MFEFKSLKSFIYSFDDVFRMSTFKITIFSIVFNIVVIYKTMMILTDGVYKVPLANL